MKDLRFGKRIINKRSIKRFVSYVMMASMVLGLTACGSGNGNVGAVDDGKLQVVTTIFPEYDWVREIAGISEGSADKSAAENVDVTMLLDNGVDLHSFQPTAADIAKISTCDIFIYVGGESDAWVDDALKEATNKDMVVIDLLDVLGDTVKEEEVVEGMQEEDEHEHEDADEEVDSHDGDAEAEDTDVEESEEEHEGEGHHHEEGEIEYDEHVWLSLKNAQILTSYIADKMAEKDSANAAAYKANVEAYNNKLSDLDKQYQDAVDAAEVKTLIFGDRFPFRYMVDDYGLDYYAAFVGCSAETEASFETIVFLAGKIDDLGAPVICTIEKSDQKLAQTIKENTKSQDQEIMTMDSLQSVTSEDVQAGETYISQMADNLEVLKKALGE